MIKIENVSIFYSENTILENVSIDICTGEKALVTGKSGTGKSSLLKAILGFTDFTGDIKVNNMRVASENIYRIRKLIAYMPQELSIPISSAKELFNFPFSWKSTNNTTRKEHAMVLLTKFKIDYPILEKQNNEISGGQKQRILLASCIAQNKPVFLLDEPDSSIDTENKKIIRKYLFGLKEKTIIIVSHDLEWEKYVDKTINIDNYGKNT